MEESTAELQMKLETFEKETIFVQDLIGNTGTAVNVKNENEMLETDTENDPLALDEVQDFCEESLWSSSTDSSAENIKQGSKKRNQNFFFEESLWNSSVDSAVEENKQETIKRKQGNKYRSLYKEACNTGQEYLNCRGVLVPARKMRAGCDVNCRNHCHQKISIEDRQKIFDYYWKIGNHTGQWDFIMKYVTTITREKKKSAVENSNKKRSLIYFLPASAPGSTATKQIKVCKTMFLKTLDISNSCVCTALNKLRQNSKIIIDKRGKHAKTNIQKSEALNVTIRDYINTLSIEEIPFLRENINIRQLHRTYHTWMLEKRNGERTAGERRFREIINQEFLFKFKKENIAVD